MDASCPCQKDKALAHAPQFDPYTTEFLKEIPHGMEIFLLNFLILFL